MNNNPNSLSPLSNHRGYQQVFASERMSLGFLVPIESYPGPMPTMEQHLALAKRADEIGFSALWVRDVPLFDPNFGDVGQVFDPWVYMATLAQVTERIAIASGSIILPLRHPLHTAKAAASIDVLSGERVILGIAAGDRAVEYPVFAIDYETRGDLFREAVIKMQGAWSHSLPIGETAADVLPLPQPKHRGIPLVVTGQARQSLEWIAEHCDVWMMYPRDPAVQQNVIAGWHTAQESIGITNKKPFAQSLYIDLSADVDERPSQIHLGYRLGRNSLLALLQQLEAIGVQHVALNLKYGKRHAEDVLDELGRFVLPEFV